METARREGRFKDRVTFTSSGALTTQSGTGLRALERPRRRQVILAAGTLLATPLASLAQQPTRLFRIGVLIGPAAASYVSRTEALRAGLRDFGYVEGRNALIELRSADGKNHLLSELAAELVRQSVDVIVTAGTPAIRAVKQATQTVPVVIAAVGDAVAGGFVASLSKPGGNITGSTYLAPEVAAKQLELLKETLPQTSRVAVVVNPTNPAMGSALQALRPAARSLKLELEQFAVREPHDFGSAFLAMAGKGYRTALIVDDPLTIANATAVADLALKHRVATAGFVEYAEAGGLIGYGANLIAMWRRAAFFVDKILKGMHPGDIPVERSAKFDLIINRKAAKAIEVTVAPSVLLRADRVIE